MRNTSRRFPQFTLGLLVLIAVGHANLASDLTGRAPNTSGMTQLGRDLLRKSSCVAYSRQAVPASRSGFRERAN